MTFSELLASDLPLLKELQPPDWNNIVPPFEYHISHSFCHTRKIMDGNRLAAVGTTVLHKDVAWLALIIVHPDYRGQGLGKKITMDLMDIATKHECESILLLATPMGLPVYEKLGFIPVNHGHPFAYICCRNQVCHSLYRIESLVPHCILLFYDSDFYGWFIQRKPRSGWIWYYSCFGPSPKRAF